MFVAVDVHLSVNFPKVLQKGVVGFEEIVNRLTESEFFAPFQLRVVPPHRHKVLLKKHAYCFNLIGTDL